MIRSLQSFLFILPSLCISLPALPLSPPPHPRHLSLSLSLWDFRSFRFRWRLPVAYLPTSNWTHGHNPKSVFSQTNDASKLYAFVCVCVCVPPKCPMAPNNSNNRFPGDRTRRVLTCYRVLVWWFVLEIDATQIINALCEVCETGLSWQPLTCLFCTLSSLLYIISTKNNIMSASCNANNLNVDYLPSPFPPQLVIAWADLTFSNKSDINQTLLLPSRMCTSPDSFRSFRCSSLPRELCKAQIISLPASG